MEKENAFELIGRFQYSSEAMIYKAKLESEGIEVFTRDINTIDNNPLYSNLLGGIKLFVKKDDVEKAQKILSEISEYSLNENNEPIKCLNCGAQQVKMEIPIASLKTLFNVITIGFFALFFEKHKHVCQNCKNEF